MRECAVAIVGAGPTGMMLAAELRLAGVDVVVLERRPDAELAGSRAGGLQSRTIEVFDQRGIAERFLAEGTPTQVQAYGGTVLDISDFPTRHPYGLALWQNRIEAILAEWVGELCVEVEYGAEVVGVVPDEAGVVVRLGDGHPVRAEYVVGCDGGRSLVRTAAGIDFAGWDPTVSNLIAEVEYDTSPEWGLRQDAQGVHGITRLEGGSGSASRSAGADGGMPPGAPSRETIRIVLTERTLTQGADPTLADLSAAMREIWGTDFGVHSPTWISRFTDAARQATTYRAGRILLAGDAAHTHYPAGGQGLSIGVQDAVNLGWKLAQVVSGISPAALLDTYERERHPIAARVLQDTLAQVGLRRTDPRSRAVAASVGELLRFDPARRSFGARLSGLGVHYDLRAPSLTETNAVALHPLVGRRMPDLDTVVEGVPGRIFPLLHGARPLFLGFDAPRDWIALANSTPRVRAVEVTGTGPWELPELGEVPPPCAVLVRPDGYVAWVGLPSTDPGSGSVSAEAQREALAEALSTWCGRARDALH